MVKKISAIVLALVLCLSAMVVPVSAYELGSSSEVAYEIKLDKEYYDAGDTVTISLFLYGKPGLEFGTGAIVIGLNSAVFEAAETPADIQASSTSGDAMASWYKDASTATWAWQTNATVVNNIIAGNTAEENELFDTYLKVVLAKNSSGSHPNIGSNKNGIPTEDINADSEADVAFFSIQLKLKDDIADGTVVNVGVPTGGMPKNYTYMNYYKDPGSATTVVKTTQATSEVVFAAAKTGEDPCANGHASTTPSEEVITEATCTENGTKKVTYTCDVCGEVDKTEEVAIPAAHKYYAVVTDPTCTGAGYTTYTCSVCDDYYTSDVVAALGHTEGEAVVENEVAATCNDDGSYDSVVYCSVCDAELSRTPVAVPATGEHVYAEVVDEKAATCTDDGYVTKACGCGETETTTVPATGHAYDAVVTDPTCTEAGYTTYTCACGDTYTDDEVTATGHTEGEAVVENEVAGTCTADGSYDTVVYCTVCDAELSRVPSTVPAEGHAYDAVVTEPTCTEDGYTTYTCSVCGDTKVDDTVEALGHSYETEVTAPTCTEAGYTTYTCTVCGDTYTADEVDAAGHDYEVDFVKNATCTKDGYTRYKCTVCGDEYTETIASKNHTNEDGSSATVEIPAVAPTCKNHGYTAGSKCTLCNANVVTPTRVEATGHTKDEGVVTEPTYFEGGYTTYTCTVCGEEFEDDYTDKLTVDFTFAIAEPSVTELRARDTIILHPEFVGDVAEGVTVVWTLDNENFEIVEEYEDGSIKVEAKKVVRGTDGITTFTATVVDADGSEITSDTVELTANAKFLQRLVGFFRVLFKNTANYER